MGHFVRHCRCRSNRLIYTGRLIFARNINTNSSYPNRMSGSGRHLWRTLGTMMSLLCLGCGTSFLRSEIRHLYQSLCTQIHSLSKVKPCIVMHVRPLLLHNTYRHWYVIICMCQRQRGLYRNMSCTKDGTCMSCTGISYMYLSDSLINIIILDFRTLMSAKEVILQTHIFSTLMWPTYRLKRTLPLLIHQTGLQMHIFVCLSPSPTYWEIRCDIMALCWLFDVATQMGTNTDGNKHGNKEGAQRS